MIYEPLNSKWRFNIASNAYTPAMDELQVGHLDAATVILRTLNLDDGKVFVTVKDELGKDVKVLSKELTEDLQNKMKDIHQKFNDYILNNAAAASEVQMVYNDTYNGTVARDFTEMGKLLKLPNLAPEWHERLYEHQRSGVARAIYKGNTLLAHAVGSGKTATQIISIMEYRRLGLANKPLLIVPNNKLYDYDADFKELYPHAKLLTLAQNDFQKANLTATLARAATNDWDAIIIRHSSLERIPVGNDMQVDFLRRQIREAEEVYADLADDSMQTKKTHGCFGEASSKASGSYEYGKGL